MIKNITNKTIAIVLVINSLIFYSQTINGNIKDEAQKKIAGVIVGVEGESVGDITDENGNFSVNLTDIDKSKNLIAYLGGYEPYRVKISDFIEQKGHDIILKERIIDIEPVALYHHNLVEKNIGINKKSKIRYSGFNSTENKQLLQERAIRFNNKKKLKLKNININLTDYNIIKPIMLIFDVYSSKDDMPDKSLLRNSISKEIKNNSEIKNNIISVNISDENIWVEGDFFVSVRVANDFEGYIYLSGNIFAMSQKTYYRYYYGEWKHFTGGGPSINLDVLIKK